MGHQQDNTVKYKIGTVQPTRTPVPAGSPTPIIPDPAILFTATAIPKAAAAWNLVRATPPNPNVLFTSTSGSDDDVVINVVQGGKSARLDVLQGRPHRRDPWSVLGLHHCGNTYACVKPKDLSIFPLQWIATQFNWLTSILGDHMPEMYMALEEPAWSYSSDTDRFTRYIWTGVASKHLDPLNRTERGVIPGLDANDACFWLFAPGVVMHEFGHTAGLTDLYDYKDSNDNYYYPNYLMGPLENYDATSIPHVDRAYLRQVYETNNHSH